MDDRERKVSLHPEENTRNNWNWSDALLAGTALTAVALSRNESIGSLGQAFLDFYGQAIGTYYLLQIGLLGRDRKIARENRILEGLETIRKRRGEQTIFIAGKGHPTADLAFKSDPFHTIPLLDNAEAGERMRDLFKRKGARRPFPFFLNLQLEQVGTTVVDTPALESLELTSANLVSTPSGKKLVTIGLGDTFLPKIMSNKQVGSRVIDNSLLHQRLVDKAVRQKLIESSQEAVMVRFASAYDVIVPRESEMDKYIFSRSEIEHVESDGYRLGGVKRQLIYIDTWTPIIHQIKQLFPGKQVGLHLDTYVPGLDSLPHVEQFGFVSIENVGQSVPHFKRGGEVTFVVIETDDVATLHRLEQNRNSLEKDNTLYIFDTAEASSVAVAMGAKHVICVAELQNDQMEVITTKLHIGETVEMIQEHFDNLYKHRDIIGYYNGQRAKAMGERYSASTTIPEIK